MRRHKVAGQRLRQSLLAPGFAAVLLAGCAASAPKIVVSERGIANTNTSTQSAINGFNGHYLALYDASFPTASTGVGTQSGISSLANLSDQSRQLTKEGAQLSKQLCLSFFKTAGTEQQYLLFSRDVIGVIGALATGVLGATHSSPAATAAVGLGTGASLSGISAYSRNFLFSEDNVQAVQDLTLKAMASQATASENAALLNPNYDFFDAVADIMDIQAICEVQKVLSLVRNSIAKAEPSTEIGPGGHLSTDVGTQRVAWTISSINALPPAVFLQTQITRDPDSVFKAVQQVGNFDSYADHNLHLTNRSNVITWAESPQSDPRHLEDVARVMGWRGQ